MRLKRTVSLFGAVLISSAAPLFSAPAQRVTQTASKPPASRESSAKAAAPRKKTGARKTSSRRGRFRRARGPKAPTAERIREIQSALARAGTYSQEPNGKWDAASIEALKRFQSANGLKPIGKFDAPTLQKLGLGSEIAGRAAPRPPEPSSGPPPASRPQQ